MTAPAGLRSESMAAPVPAAFAAREPLVLRLATLGFALYAAMLPVGLAPMTIAGVLCVGLAIAAAVTLRGVPWVRTPVDMPALAWLAATIVATAFAVDPRASAGSLGKSLMPLVTGLIAWLALDARRGAAAVAAMLAAGTIAALVGAGRFVAAGGHFPARAIGLSGSWMTFGVQMMLLASLGAAIALTSRSPRWRQGATIAALAALIALAASFTRAAWIGAVVALAVVFGLTRPRALIGLAVAFVAVLLIPGDFGDRLRSAFDPGHPMNRERELMWQAGRHILRDHPWVARNLYNAFEEARRRSLQRLRRPGYIALPGHGEQAAAAAKAFGGDYFPYGIEENRAALELFLRYAHEQGIARRLMTPEQIFPPGINVKVAV